MCREDYQCVEHTTPYTQVSSGFSQTGKIIKKESAFMEGMEQNVCYVNRTCVTNDESVNNVPGGLVCGTL